MGVKKFFTSKKKSEEIVKSNALKELLTMKLLKFLESHGLPVSLVHTHSDMKPGLNDFFVLLNGTEHILSCLYVPDDGKALLYFPHPEEWENKVPVQFTNETDFFSIRWAEVSSNQSFFLKKGSVTSFENLSSDSFLPISRKLPKKQIRTKMNCL